MARVAVNAVVDVAVDAAMPWVGCRCGVTSCACEDRVVRRVGVTGCTHAVRTAVIKREEGVVAGRQCGGEPCGCGVAGGAGGGPAGSDVIGIRCAGEVGLVA